jgi:pantoate--beta-alanine ligase
VNPPRPQLIHKLSELRQTVALARSRGAKIGLVPTMGALHAGHLSLVQAARAECDFTVVWIFVNPSQFGPNEDYQRYPRTLEADMAKLSEVGADAVFSPAVEDVYPSGYATWVDVESVAKPLEGACRPVHFRGVATIVLKLFNMVGADFAYFGQKDYQQVAVIRRMVADLNVPITIRMCPIVREADGLAMSSRNAYLSSDDRQRAAALYRSLQHAETLVREGERDAQKIAAQMKERILSIQPARIDYIALVDPDTLAPVDRISGPTLAALAVVVGKTRLIDNVLLDAPKASRV